MHINITDDSNAVDESGAKDAAKAMAAHLKSIGVEIKYSQALNVIARMGGCKEWRAMLARLNATPAVTKQPKPRVLITVSGGIAEWVGDDGVRVEHFDWDNYNQEDEAGQKSMALSEAFRDLAAPMGIPIEGEK